VEVTISSRHMDVSEPLRNHAEQKATKLGRFYDRIENIEVVFDAKKDGIRVEMIVSAEHRNMFLAHCDGADAYAGIDGCYAKLERQISEHKAMFRNRKHSGDEKHGKNNP
jgi:putative sigma-54 modulation protein